MIMEYFCIGFLAGAIFAALFFMMGLLYDGIYQRIDQRKHLDDNGVRIYISDRLRNRCGDK